MLFWQTLWTIVLILGLLIFAVLSVVVAIGGYADLRALFRDIDAQHQSSKDAGDET